MTLVLKIMIVVAFAIIIQYLVTIVYQKGYHKTIFPHYPGPCRNVPPVTTGSSDIAVTKDGLAFITSGLNLLHSMITVDKRVKNHKGAIYLFDFNHPEKPAKLLTITNLKKYTLKSFNPHGLCIWEDAKSDHITLFVVNHRTFDGSELIEIMKYNKATKVIRHNRTLSDPLFRSLNGISAVGPNSFFVTNDGFYHYSIVRLIERFSMYPWGNILFYDGKKLKVSLPKSFEYHGIAVSSDKRFLYVTAPLRQSVFIFEIVNGFLRAVQDVALGTSAVNLKVLPETGIF